jgi:hypothetical protein
MYTITPCDIITTKTITSFKIDRIEITLFKSAVVTVILLDSANAILDVKFVNMAGEDYAKWNADDTYVIEFIKNSLGFSSVVKAPVEEAPVEETPVIEAPVEEAPVEEAPVEEAPVEEAPVEEAPVEEAPVEEAPVEEAPVE